ncbi:cellulose binding domain-containing protein [Glycomyces harbinensis]|uniref:Cellulose binding domain-containing protein n=1 Tax=Glycomyces harbinensis TaxID=58114 RepID=A0A1G7C4A3_9ACTN|nr:cellulose binding domain-containing protein [Glycomyces harbinensis]SDE34083.1 Cellulose binding domain-containing protein [Glycomyces harbinensis]
MHRTGDVPARRGRLHGRLLHVLGGFSALVAVIALWQLGVFGGDPDREPVGAVDGPETAWQSPGEESTSAPHSAEAASATIESPSESSAAATSDAPSDDAGSSAAAEETSAREEEEEVDDIPSDASCSATLTLEEAWDDSVEVSVEVVNTGGTELESWSIDLDIDDSDIEHYWSMRELGWDWYGSEDWNGRLDPDENAVVGFQAETDRGFELPASVQCEARV